MTENISKPCVFIDETGTSKDDPFFGVGFLKVENPYPISCALQAPHNRAKSSLAAKRRELHREILEDGRHISPDELNVMMRSTRHTEFHFTEIHPANLESYKSVLEAVKPFSFHFCALMVNKRDPKFNPEIYRNPWDFYIHLLKLLCRTNLKENEQASVVVDYMTKPKISTKELDRELLCRMGGRVANVQLVDSVGVSMIQLCDILLGAVAFQNRRDIGHIHESNKTTAREDFVPALCDMIGISGADQFLRNMTVNKNGKYFSVWHLKLK